MASSLRSKTVLPDKKQPQPQPDLSISDEQGKINIFDETVIEGTYVLCGQCEVEDWSSLRHFILYLTYKDGIIRISHVERGRNLISWFPLSYTLPEDENILSKGNFKCKKSDIYTRALSLWSKSDSIYADSTIFPSSCSGFVLSVLIFISDDFCHKLIQFMKDRPDSFKGVIKLSNLEKAMWMIGKIKFDEIKLRLSKKDLETKTTDIKELDFKYVDYDIETWKEIVDLYNLKNNIKKAEEEAKAKVKKAKAEEAKRSKPNPAKRRKLNPVSLFRKKIKSLKKKSLKKKSLKKKSLKKKSLKKN